MKVNSSFGCSMPVKLAIFVSATGTNIYTLLNHTILIIYLFSEHHLAITIYSRRNDSACCDANTQIQFLLMFRIMFMLI